MISFLCTLTPVLSPLPSRRRKRECGKKEKRVSGREKDG